MYDAQNAVWSLSEARGSDRVMMLALAKYADSEGYCWPGNPLLKRLAKLEERAVRSSLRRLEHELHEIASLEGRGKGHHTLYRILLGQPEDAGDPKTMLAWLRSKTSPYLAQLYASIQNGRPETGAGRPVSEGNASDQVPDEKGSSTTVLPAVKGSSNALQKGSSTTVEPGAYRNELSGYEEVEPKTFSRPHDKRATEQENSPDQTDQGKSGGNGTYPPPGRSKTKHEPSADAMRLCERLAAHVESTNPKLGRPKVEPGRWGAEMDRLLRLGQPDRVGGEPIPPAQVDEILDWLEWGDSEESRFWRPNIKSPHKLRAKLGDLDERMRGDRAWQAHRAPVGGVGELGAGRRLAERLAASVGRRRPEMPPPAASPAWAAEFDALVHADGLAEAEVVGLIDWLETGQGRAENWQHILDPAALRTRARRLLAERKGERRNGNGDRPEWTHQQPVVDGHSNGHVTVGEADW